MSCSNGTHDRERVCNEPKYGGAPCPGNNNSTEWCFLIECPGNHAGSGSTVGWSFLSGIPRVVEHIVIRHLSSIFMRIQCPLLFCRNRI